MHLQIRAEGLVSACRTVPLDGTVHVNLEAGRRVEVRLPRDLPPAVVRELSALSDVPGSDCPVPLADLAPTVTETAPPGQPSTFAFEHFPSTSRLGLLRFPSAPRQILVPDRGDIIIER